MIEILTAVMAAGDSRDFHINGERFEILDCQYPIDVLLLDKSGGQQSTMKNAEASFFAQPKEGFQTIKITSQQAQIVRMFVGSGDAGTRRISSTVAVIDGGKARSVANAAFSGYSVANGAASQFALTQLWNPAGSGKRLVLGQIYAGASIASALYGFKGTVARPALLTNALPKMMSGVAGVGQVRAQSLASLPTFTSIVMFSLYAQPLVTINYKPTEPIVIDPGYGLDIVASTANSDCLATYDWYEEAI